jgi:hypothetical protein
LPLAPVLTTNVHPSSIFAPPDEETRREELKRFIDDLKKVAKAARQKT